ncbi:hypothetical protein ACFS5L_38740 [Streptomyces phyllanthi]|uniref:Uncharacterized protein n=1 Tax=Streptomyces phyllanthi TaxID=1803180 RepID=A0A5N8VWX1_9ACTN|nr:hypothetical protein [Streptomyces phyllanthi]MPY39216.1 hypothetical protein [Streptomyces phyllanthi]
MSTAEETSLGGVSEPVVTTTQSPLLTTEILDCAATPLEDLAAYDSPVLNRLLPSRQTLAPTFNSSL